MSCDEGGMYAKEGREEGPITESSRTLDHETRRKVYPRSGTCTTLSDPSTAWRLTG